MTVSADIIAAHADAVWRTVYRLLNNREDALDCYQQTFLDAMRLDGQKVRDWKTTLCCIATRRGMDQLRADTETKVFNPLRTLRCPSKTGLTNEYWMTNSAVRYAMH